MRTLWMVTLVSVSLASPEVWAQKSKPDHGLQTGLKGEYFNGPNFERKVLTRTDAQVDFNWNWEAPGPGVQREYFSVRWTGKLYAPTTGKYRFSATVDDGVRVWVNGKKVIDEWRKQDDSQFVGEIQLNGRQLYDLRIEYYNDWKGSVISVFWESPQDRRLLSLNATPHQTIPANYLFNAPNHPATTVKRKLTPVPAVPVAVSRSARARVKPTMPEPVSHTPKSDGLPLVAASAKPIYAFRPVQTSVVSVAPDPTPATVDLPFANLRVGETGMLRSVRFVQSECTLLSESYAELEKFLKALQANPTLRVEVAGHTDNVGDKRLNQTLSEYRAKVIATYLIRHGISDTRITFKGYGGARPLVENTSEAQRAQNRRVEFTVIE